MANRFHVQLLDFCNLQEIEGAWATSDITALLDTMEFGDRSGLGDEELREMCLMSLQDQGPEEAAYVVLKHVIGDALREGQLRNMANEMLEEKLWEEYVDPAFHQRLFNVGSLLSAAMPQVFPKPDAVRIKLEVTALDADAKWLLTSMSNEAFLVRLLADGMDSNAVLRRLYGEQLTGDSFPDADTVVWIVSADFGGKDVTALEVISSGYWLNPLENIKAYESNAYGDKTEPNPPPAASD